MAPLNQKPVLISGAGPTGMFLALWLQHLGIPIRLIDKSPRVESTSRAMVVHARTLEFYRQLGIADEAVRGGVIVERFCINHNGVRKGFVPTALVGKDISRFNMVLSLPQDRHEAQLEAAFLARGGVVERNIEFVSFSENDSIDGVQAKLRHTSGPKEGQLEDFEASYVVGCDGAHSAVRAACKDIRMEGGTYKRRFFVADVEGTVPIKEAYHEINVHLSSNDFVLLMPLPEPNRYRLVGFVPEEFEDAEEIKFANCEATVERNVKITIQKVNWFSHYKVHHRAASHFRQNRAFLLGDACHLHSPVGGQGMNTGLGDAMNLAWKLATVMRGKEAQTAKGTPSTSLAMNALLDSYEVERIRFARTLVNTTDFAFTLLTGDSWPSWIFRNFVFPNLIPFMIRWLGLAPTMFRKTSQVEIEYQPSELSSVQAGGGMVAGAGAGGLAGAPGDRLPWLPQAALKMPSSATVAASNATGTTPIEADNYSTFKGVTWRVHVYSDGDTVAAALPPKVKALFDARGVPIHVFDWSTEAGKVGLVKNAAYLIRPDVYIGTICGYKSLHTDEDGVVRSLKDYCDRWGVGLI